MTVFKCPPFDFIVCWDAITTPGKRVQTINPPGSEVGPGVVATWGMAVTDEADGMGFK